MVENKKFIEAIIVRGLKLQTDMISLHQVDTNRLIVATHCLSNAAVALNTRRGGLKAKCNEVDVEQDEDSVQSYQCKEDIQ
jgi:hypothetical protein